MLDAILLAALSFGNAHAPLHPSNADLYLEIPAPKQLLASREHVPWNRFFADEDMKKLCTLLEGFDVPLQTISSSAFPEEILGEKSPLRRLDRASFSLGGLDELGKPDAKSQLAFSGVLEFADAAAAEGALVMIDGWTLVARSTDASLAKDCKLGEHTCNLRWYESTLGSTFSAFSAGAGRTAASAAQAASSRVWVAQDGPRLYLGAMGSTPEALSARIAGSQAGLADESKLFAGMDSFTPSSGTPVYRLWSDLDLKHVFEGPAGTGMDEQTKSLVRWILPVVLPYAGAQGAWRVELRGERFVSEAVYKRYPEFDHKSLGQTAADPAAARFVPKEAVGAWVTSVDPKSFEAELRGMLGTLLVKPPAAEQNDESADPKPAQARDHEREELARKAAELVQQLPPLSEGLGTQAAFYLLPINSIQAILPRAFLAVELKDKAKFEAALNTWATKFAELDPKTKLTNKPYRKLTCVSLALGKEEDEQAAVKASPLAGMTPDMSLSPTIVVFEDRVLFGIKKSYVQSETRRIADGKGNEAHAIAAAGRIPKDSFEASVMDWGGFYGKLLDVLKQLVPMATGMMGANAPQIDATALPGSATLARYFQPTNSWSKRLADGRIYSYSESSFGPETPLQIAAFAASAGTAMTQMRTQPRAATTEPASPEPQADDSALKTRAALLSVKTGLAIYRSQLNKLPAKLEDLLAPTDSFPGGFLAPEKALPLDGWGHALVFKPEPDGRKFLLYSFGADGKDDGGGGDDVKAP